jgi:hypothetical protein
VRLERQNRRNKTVDIKEERDGVTKYVAREEKDRQCSTNSETGSTYR